MGTSSFLCKIVAHLTQTFISAASLCRIVAYLTQTFISVATLCRKVAYLAQTFISAATLCRIVAHLAQTFISAASLCKIVAYLVQTWVNIGALCNRMGCTYLQQSVPFGGFYPRIPVVGLHNCAGNDNGAPQILRIVHKIERIPHLPRRELHHHHIVAVSLGH